MTPPDDPADTRADEAATLLAEMRASVEAATRQLEALSSELTERRALLDDLETVVDLLLGIDDTVVVVIDDGRRITGLSRAATERLEGATVGKPLSSVLAAPVVDQLFTRLDHEQASELELPAAGEGARVRRLPGGGAVLVFAGS